MSQRSKIFRGLVCAVIMIMAFSSCLNTVIVTSSVVNALASPGYGYSRFHRIWFQGQFGWPQPLEDIAPNATLDALWEKIEVDRITVATKAWSLADYEIGIGVLHNTDVSLAPIPNEEIPLKQRVANAWLTYFITVHTAHSNATKFKVNQASKRPEFFNLETLTKHYGDKYSKVISLTELLAAQHSPQQHREALADLSHCLSTNGWCFVEYPEVEFNTIQSIFGRVKEFMSDNINDVWYYNKYYYEYELYKKVLHVFTGDIFDLYEYKYPLPILSDLKVLSHIIDTLSMDIMRVLCAELFGLQRVRDFMQYNVSLLNDPNNPHGLNYRAGMLDFVLYDNTKDKEHIPEHTDPGLFSLSFGSDNLGLQMFDLEESKWINVPNNYGVLWCGEIASTISNKRIKPGIHRVIRNGDNTQPRFTAWYEVCVNDQIWPYKRTWDEIWAESRRIRNSHKDVDDDDDNDDDDDDNDDDDDDNDDDDDDNDDDDDCEFFGDC